MVYFFFFLIFLLPVTLLASPAEEVDENRIALLDRMQDLIGGNFNHVANRLDSFFATERADDELGRSLIRIRSRYHIAENFRPNRSTVYRINLKLPNLEERFRFRYYENQINQKEPEPLNEEDQEKLKRLDKFNTDWIFNTDLGINASIPPVLTARARLRKSKKTGTLIHRFVQQLTYATNESGLINDTSLTTDHVFNEKLLFRFINSAQWRITLQEFRTQHGPTLLQQITDDDGFNYGAIMHTVVESIWFVNNYQLYVDYRRNLYQQWIYMDIIPGIDFPKYFSFRRNPFITLQLEVLFGQ